MPDRYGDTPGPDDLWAAEVHHQAVLHAITRCGLCDADGYRGSIVCNHQDSDQRQWSLEHSQARNFRLRLLVDPLEWLQEGRRCPRGHCRWPGV